MFPYNFTVEIDVIRCFIANELLALLFGEKVPAVHAVIQLMFFLFDEQLQMIPVQPRHDFVGGVVEQIDGLHLDFGRDHLQNLLVETRQIERELHDFVEVFAHKMDALFHQSDHLEKVRGDQDGDDVVHFQFGLFPHRDVLDQPLKHQNVAMDADIELLLFSTSSASTNEPTWSPLIHCHLLPVVGIGNSSHLEWCCHFDFVRDE